MTRVIHGTNDTTIERALARGDSLWLERDDVERATGWTWKPHGLCREDACLPVARGALIDGERLDVAGLWRQVGWPVVHNRAGDAWVLGEASGRGFDGREAPELVLPDLAGRQHRLSDLRGRKVFLVAWASWCGCRMELPAWQRLHEELASLGFTVVAVALDEAEAARPWIEAASPTFPSLIDREHLTAERFNLVNVPTAVWIDEEGKLVRAPEPAGMTDTFRAMDRKTFTLPDEAKLERDRTKAAYLDAVRDWARRGAESPYVLEKAELTRPAAEVAEAHAWFRLGLASSGDEARAAFDEATRLHPESWAMWRQVAEKLPNGLAAGEAFWRRVDALGERRYYAPVELERR